MNSLTEPEEGSSFHSLLTELRQRVEHIEQFLENERPKAISLSYDVLSAFILPERRNAIMDICRRLDYYLVPHPSGQWLLEFDVEGKPAKFRKTQVYERLALLLPYLEVTKEWFFLWTAQHTNLATSAYTVKNMIGA